MNRKTLIIIIIIIIIGFAAFSLTKQDVQLNVWAEEIPNTEDIYFICELRDMNGSIIDTSLGKCSIELLDTYGNGVSTIDVPFEHGIIILRMNGEYERVNVHYDGGYIFNPCDYSNNLTIIEYSGINYENLTGSF